MKHLVARWRALVGVLAAVLLAMPMLATSPAAAIDCRNCHVGSVYGGTGWAGSYRVNIGNASRVVYCIEPHKWYAQGTYRYDGAWQDDNGHRLGAMLWKYGSTSDRPTATAVSMLVARYGAGSMEQWDSFPELHTLANDIWGQTNKDRGPYHIVNGGITQEPTWDNDATLKVRFWIDGAEGAPGFEIPQSWLDPLAVSNVKDLSVQRFASNGFIVSAHVADWSQAWRIGARLVNYQSGADVWRPVSQPQAQAVVGWSLKPVGDPVALSGDAMKYKPSAVTQTQQVLVSAGDVLRDKVDVSGGHDGHPFSGESSLYGPFESNQAALDADVSGMTPVGTATFEGTYDAEGKASAVTDGVKVPSDGYYVWVEQLFETKYGVAFTADKDSRVTEPSALVKLGQHVKAGQQIAIEGSSGDSTGCHLHFEVWVNGSHTDPVPFMESVGITLGQVHET